MVWRGEWHATMVFTNRQFVGGLEGSRCASRDSLRAAFFFVGPAFLGFVSGRIRGWKVSSWEPCDYVGDQLVIAKKSPTATHDWRSDGGLGTAMGSIEFLDGRDDFLMAAAITSHITLSFCDNSTTGHDRRSDEATTHLKHRHFSSCDRRSWGLFRKVRNEM